MSEHGVNTVDEILDQIAGVWRSAILWAAFDLHVADHILAGRDTAGSIAAAEGADARAVGILMDAFCALGFADKADGRYRLEPVAEALLPSHPSGFGRTHPIWLNEFFWSAWGRLPEVVRTGKPVEAMMGADHAFWDTFARASFGVAQLQGMGAAHLLGIEAGAGVRVLDVGCGSGGVGYAFALADPAATVTGLDIAPVLEIAAEHARELGISDRVTLETTDIVQAESFGDAKYDVAVVSHILHGLDPGACEAMLAKVARALVPGGRIVINEFVPDEERRRAAYPLMFGVQMMLGSGGNVYTLREISAWLTAAGVGGVELHPSVAHVGIVVGTKR